MASIKVKFRPSSVTNREGIVYYQIIHERKVRQLPTRYHVFPSEWDEKRSMVTTSGKSERCALILSIRERIRWEMERLTKINRRLDANGLSYTADDVIDGFNSYTHEYSLSGFMERIIAKLRQNGKVRTAETYTSTLNSFRKFLASRVPMEGHRQDEDIMLDCIDSEIMEAFEAWHQQRGIVPNTISFYIRVLRAVYNRAVEEDIIESRNPFRRVYTGVDKTVKRALPLQMVRKIKALDLSAYPALDYARDMFMLSFMLRGMSFIDMAYLRKRDLADGYVTYRRRKTGQQLVIAWTKEMQRVLDKYPENKSPYLLPIIKNIGMNERCAYRNAGYKINSNLKKVAEKAGLSFPLSLYVARHSWASIARSKGVPISIISEGMGHDSETTTQIYLASLDTTAVDRANAMLIQLL